MSTAHDFDRVRERFTAPRGRLDQTFGAAKRIYLAIASLEQDRTWTLQERHRTRAAARTSTEFQARDPIVSQFPNSIATPASIVDTLRGLTRALTELGRRQGLIEARPDFSKHR